MENVLDVQMVETLYAYYSQYELLPKEWLVPDTDKRETLESLAEQKMEGSLDPPRRELFREYQKAHRELTEIDLRMSFASGMLCGIAMTQMLKVLISAMPSAPPVEIDW